MTTTLDSIIIATQQPATLADWYSSLLHGERRSDNEVWADGLRIIVFPHDEIVGASVEPQRTMINFAVDDAEEFLSHANRLGVNWLRRFEPEHFGKLATVIDPDGNYVQFVEHPAPTVD